MNYLRKHGELGILLVVLITTLLFGLSRLLPEMGVLQKILMLIALIFWVVALGWCLFKADFPFLRRNKEKIGLGLLVAYALILALATVSEILELGWFEWL